MTGFWHNLHPVHSKLKDERQIIFLNIYWTILSSSRKWKILKFIFQHLELFCLFSTYLYFRNKKGGTSGTRMDPQMNVLSHVKLTIRYFSLSTGTWSVIITKIIFTTRSYGELIRLAQSVYPHQRDLTIQLIFLYYQFSVMVHMQTSLNIRIINTS